MRRYILIAREHLFLISALLIVCSYGCKSQVNEKAVQQIEVENEQTEVKSVVNVLHQVQRGDTLEIISDGQLTWNPFAITLAVDSLQKRYGNMFDIEKEGMTTRLQKGKSFIKVLKTESVENAEDLAEYHHTILSTYKLVDALILDDDIRLQHGIKVGMNKEDFFSLLGYQGDVNDINIVRNFDPPGDFIEQTFVFREGKLSRIHMQFPY